MRRKDREITDMNKIEEIIKKCDVCRLAFFDEEYPYIIPMNFGVAVENEKVTLYFHGAKVGKKIDLLRKNKKVGFEMDCSHQLILEDEACNSTMEYESVCGNGSIEILEESEKIEALNHIMRQYTGKMEHRFGEREVKAVTVLKLKVHEIFAKALKQ